MQKSLLFTAALNIIDSNDDMKLPKGHTTFKSLIFLLLKLFSKSFFAGNYQKNVRNCTPSVAVVKKSSFNFVLKLSPRTLEIAFQSFQISKFSAGACSQIPLHEGAARMMQSATRLKLKQLHAHARVMHSNNQIEINVKYMEVKLS